jgi:hypothetical protein
MTLAGTGVPTRGERQAFYRGAIEPASNDRSDTVDIARVQTSAQQNPQAIQLLGPPPFEAVLNVG